MSCFDKYLFVDVQFPSLTLKQQEKVVLTRALINGSLFQLFASINNETKTISIYTQSAMAVMEVQNTIVMADYKKQRGVAWTPWAPLAIFDSIEFNSKEMCGCPSSYLCMDRYSLLTLLDLTEGMRGPGKISLMSDESRVVVPASRKGFYLPSEDCNPRISYKNKVIDSMLFLEEYLVNYSDFDTEFYITANDFTGDTPSSFTVNDIDVQGWVSIEGYPTALKATGEKLSTYGLTYLEKTNSYAVLPKSSINLKEWFVGAIHSICVNTRLECPKCPPCCIKPFNSLVCKYNSKKDIYTSGETYIFGQTDINLEMNLYFNFTDRTMIEIMYDDRGDIVWGYPGETIIKKVDGKDWDFWKSVSDLSLNKKGIFRFCKDKFSFTALPNSSIHIIELMC